MRGTEEQKEKASTEVHMQKMTKFNFIRRLQLESLKRSGKDRQQDELKFSMAIVGGDPNSGNTTLKQLKK